jgi:hypothetical protein
MLRFWNVFPEGNLRLLTKEEIILEDMIDKITEIGRCYGVEINVEQQKK